MNDPTFSCGHARVPSNTTRRGPYDTCRTCANERQRVYDRSRRAQQREEQAELQRLREINGQATPERQIEIDSARSLIAEHDVDGAAAVIHINAETGTVHDRITGEMFGVMSASRDEAAGEWLRELIQRFKGER